MLIENEAKLLAAFRPRDRKHVILPNTMRYPLQAEPYLSWTEPSGHRVYLVFRLPEWDRFAGITFLRDAGSAFSAPNVCEWCLHHGPSDQVSILSATVNSKRRVGVSVCLRLDCARKLAKIAEQSGMKPSDLLPPVLQKMARFCREGLEWDPVAEE